MFVSFRFISAGYLLLPHFLHERHGAKGVAVLDTTPKNRIIRAYVRFQIKAALNLVKGLDRATHISATIPYDISTAAKQCKCHRRVARGSWLGCALLDAPELRARKDNQVERLNADLLAIGVPCLHGVVRVVNGLLVYSDRLSSMQHGRMIWYDP